MFLNGNPIIIKLDKAIATKAKSLELMLRHMHNVVLNVEDLDDYQIVLNDADEQAAAQEVGDGGIIIDGGIPAAENGHEGIVPNAMNPANDLFSGDLAYELKVFQNSF